MAPISQPYLSLQDWDKTSLWSIKRHKWIKGPKLPKEIAEDTQYYTMPHMEAIKVMDNLQVFVLDEHCYFTRLSPKRKGPF